MVPRSEDAASALAAAIDRTMVSSEMKLTAEAHAVRLQATDPPAAAASLLESLV